MRSLSNGVGNFNTEYRYYQTFGSLKDCDEHGKKMLDAHNKREQKRLEAIQLEARIRKLQIEEEKVKKRIKDT